MFESGGSPASLVEAALGQLSAAVDTLVGLDLSRLDRDDLLELLRGLAGKGRPFDSLDRSSATVNKVSEALAKARVAHLATHGFYDATRFAEEEQRRLRWRRFRCRTFRHATILHCLFHLKTSTAVP